MPTHQTEGSTTMSTDQPTPSARRTVDWGLLGMRAIFVAFTVTVSALSLMQYGTSPAWVATTVLVPVAATIALDRIVRGLGFLHDTRAAARG
jgi:hypothetical protein